MEQVKFSELAHYTLKQKEARRAAKKHKFTLFGGAMGGGKSYWARWQLLEYLLGLYQKYGLKNVMVGLFCEDYPALKDRHLSKIKFEFPAWLGELRETDHNFVLRPGFGSGVMAFRNLDDPSKYQSAEFAGIAVDELTKNTKDVFDFLRTRLRWPGVQAPKFFGATNPGGVGHEWVKRYWLNKDFDPNEKEADQFVYIPARAMDNPYIDPSYVRSLEGLPEDMRKAFLEGDWDIFKGQFFKEFRRELHVVPPFNIVDVLDSQLSTYFISIDYGYNMPSCVLWHLRNREGFHYVYRELYVSGLTFEALAKEIVAMTPELHRIEYVVADPSIWAKKGETELSGAEILSATWNQLRPYNPIRLVRGVNERILGWEKIHSFLKPILYQGEKCAKIRIFETCSNLIRTLPALVYDEHKPEDLDTDGEDHAADSLRYALMTMPTDKELEHKMSFINKQTIERAQKVNRRPQR